MDLYTHFRSKLRLLNTYELHQKLINLYVTQARRSEKFKKDIDVIRENHKFLWDEEPQSWEEQLAKKYYDRLFKEYCIADLTFYKDGKVALRWQIEAELVSGKGQFICGEKHCKVNENLKTWEVNFGYMEHGEKKNALVKLRLCNDCSDRLNYTYQRKEIKKNKKRKRRYTPEIEADCGTDNDNHNQSEKSCKKNSKNCDSSTTEDAITDNQNTNDSEETASTSLLPTEEDNIWKRANVVVEEKSREEEFEEFLDQLLF